MELLRLPEEILIMIVHKLDTKSISNLYETCSVFKNIICMQGVVKDCQFSMNTLATVKTFKLRFFLDIASHVQELNLCGVPDLRKSYLIPALKKMKSLITLDISFTQLNLLDFIDVYKACPTIINVSLNFMISKSGLSKLSDESIRQCQNMFKNMSNIHLVGSVTNLLYSKVVLLLLQDAKLDTLKYTIAESDRMHTIYMPQQAELAEMIKFKKFYLCFLDWTTIYAFFGSFFMLPVLSIIDIDSVETIIIIKQNFKQFCIHASPLFQTYFQETFDVDTDKIYITEYKDVIIGNAVMMIWKKEDHNFDATFFNNLTKTLKQFFPCDCTPFTESSVPDKYNWFFLTPLVPDNRLEKPYEATKRKRVAPPPVTLDYDELFKTKDQLQLSLLFDEFIINPVTLSSKCEYLSKLTYLSITGSIKFTSEFYNILFKSCINLVTLNIEAPSISPCVTLICKAVHQSKTLKNFRLADRAINFDLLYRSLAKCPTLENICLVEESSAETVELGDPTVLFDACPNLYSLFIEAPLAEATKNRKIQAWNGAKLRYNVSHLHIMVHAKSDISKIFYSYDPFISVFNLNPIKQI